MTSTQLVLLAVAGEGALAVAALAWIGLRDLDVGMGDPVAGLGLAIAGTAGFAALQYYVVRHAPEAGPVRAMRRLYREVLRPVFGQLDARAIAVVSIMAGVGEELFFRGAMQAELGWLVSSLVFGLLHVSGRETIVLGAWAAVAGALLSALAVSSGGLWGPVVAHAAYDAAALSYIRWGPGPPPTSTVSPGGEGTVR